MDLDQDGSLSFDEFMLLVSCVFIYLKVDYESYPLKQWRADEIANAKKRMFDLVPSSGADIEAVKELIESDEFINLAKESFQEYDVDGSGYLEDEEITALCEQLYEVLIDSGYTVSKPGPSDVKQFMWNVDTSGDGKLSIDEYVQMVK